ncbi:MAG: diguanylate cyclase [Deltaproteobacteria bacterium]|nr:diguanylate cyclase [Deltaproteobacteria bacterium]
MSTTTERVTGMSIRAYLALGLTVMALLFTASFFYFMSMTREMSVSGTKTYGAFMALTEARNKADLALLERLREAEGALNAARQNANTLGQADAALGALAASIAELSAPQTATEDMLLQLRRTATLAHDFENNLLMAFLLLGAGLVTLFGLLRLHLARPLQGIMAFLNQLGTGAASQPPKRSFIVELGNIAASLENLGTYLSLATVRSQKLASEHDHFQKMSLVDGLTGVGNRRAFDEKLRTLWLQAQQGQTPLSLIMLDVDTFKRYNDNLGHQAGDECLRRVAAAMSRAARSTDVCARYGGEEFALLLPGADAAKAQVVAARVHAEVAREQLPHPASPVSTFVTVSLGVSCIRPQPDQDIESHTLVRQTDAALYEAKAAGRNRTCVYG